LHFQDETTIDDATKIADQVDYLFLDSGNHNDSVKKLGRTGKVHNWDISRRIVRSFKKKVFLASGLKSNNIILAIQKVKPYGVDLCSGFRTDKKLDPKK